MDYFRLGLLGQNISYSLSPRIFDWALQRMGLSGGYEIIDRDPNGAALFLREGVREFRGVNVTVPFKVLAARASEFADEHAALSQSVNTLAWEGTHLRGYNTDVAGFIYALTELIGRSRRIERVLVIGAGGAARAVVVALRTIAITHLTIVVRDRDKTRKTWGSLLPEIAQLLSSSEASQRVGEYDLVIQATPIGGVHLPGNPLLEGNCFSEESIVMDLIYAPRETEFLRMARACGARTMNGLPMLISQAGAAFEIWTGVRFPMADAMSDLLPKLQHS